MTTGANIVRIRLFSMLAWEAGSEEAGRAKMFERPAPWTVERSSGTRVLRRQARPIEKSRQDPDARAEAVI